jgi:TolA-binding protein
MQAALADAWLAAGSNEQAVAEYRIYLETYGEPARMPAALRGKAWGLFRLRAYGEAAMAFQQAAAAFSNLAPRVECLLKAADALHADGRYEQAAALYEQVAREAPESPLAAPSAFMAADALERLGAADAAERAFAALAAGGRGTLAIDSLLRLATLHERRNAIEEAVADYGRAIVALATNDARRGVALLGRGRARYRSYQFEAAIADCLLAQEGFAAVAAEAAHLRMLALYGAGRDDESWQLAQTFTQQYPASPLLPETQLWMAKFNYNRHAFAEAQRLFLAYVERWPASNWADAALLWAGSAACRRSEYTAAVEIMSRLPRDYPASPRLAEARFVQAEALCELARFEEAILVLDEIVNRYPESEWVTPAWMRKGDSLLALGSGNPKHYEQAMQAYAVVEARPDVTIEQALQAAYKSGRCLEKLRRADEALERYYDRVVVRFLRERGAGVWHGTAAQTWFASAGLQAAELLEARGDYEAAVRVLQRVEQADVPGKVEARTRLQRIQAEYRWHWQPPRRPAGEEGEP